MITQEELGKMLGLTRTTVARALNGSKNIKDETKKRVLELAEKEGYKKNYLGSSLAGKGKKRVYALIAKSLNEEYAIQLKKGIKAVQEEFEDFDLKIKIFETDIKDVGDQIEKLKKILSKNIDGLIITPLDPKVINQLIIPLKERIKIVTIGGSLKGTEDLFIESGYHKSGKIAGNILKNMVEKGKKILVLDGGDDRISSKKYLEGFLEIVDEQKIGCVGPIHVENMLENRVKIKEYLSDEIGGIYLNRFAGEVIENLEIKMEKNIKIVTNGLTKKIENLLKEEIISATVVEDFYEQGYFAGKSIFEFLYKPGLKKPHNYVSKINILFKESLV